MVSDCFIMICSYCSKSKANIIQYSHPSLCPFGSSPKLLVSHTVPTLKALLINSEFKFENPVALPKYYWAVCIYDLDKLGVLDGEGKAQSQ